LVDFARAIQDFILRNWSIVRTGHHPPRRNLSSSTCAACAPLLGGQQRPAQ